MSIANYLEGAILDAVFNVALQKSARYLQLHTGDPGENGTANVASNNTRKSITGAASVTGTFTSVNDLIWVGVPTTEVYTHCSIWDASTAGNCLFFGPLSVTYAATSGDTVTLPTGLLTVSVD